LLAGNPEAASGPLPGDRVGIHPLRIQLRQHGIDSQVAPRINTPENQTAATDGNRAIAVKYVDL
jgi:hypothetical protein